MLILNKYINDDDVIQGRIFLFTNVIARWQTERLSYRRRLIFNIRIFRHKFNKLEKDRRTYRLVNAFIEKMFYGFQGTIMRDRSI